jgi:hypothetical protein
MGLKEETDPSPIIKNLAFIQLGENFLQTRQAAITSELPSWKTDGAPLRGFPGEKLSRVIHIQHGLLGHFQLACCFAGRNMPALFGSHLLPH